MGAPRKKAPVLKTVTFQLDPENYRSLREALAEWRRPFKERGDRVIVADGDGDLDGKILAEVCRSFLEYREHVTRFAKARKALDAALLQKGTRRVR